MKNIISAVILIVFVIGGATAADFVKGSGSLGSEKTHDSKDSYKIEKKSGHGKNDKGHGDKRKDDKGHGEDEGKSKSGSSSYFKFSRQFVVPVINSGKVQSLVMLDINLELDSSASEQIYTMEPKLRDAIMRALLGLSNEGVFDDRLTNPENYDMMRKKLLKASREIIKDSVKDVLILDIARQDQ